jgi:hypothetical protein
MGRDFIDDLLDGLKRAVTPDTALLRDVIVLSGLPERTENLRYLGFNNQVFEEDNRKLEFSAVVVINNHRADNWRLSGYGKKISQLVFNTRWTRNALDLFINNLRCDPQIMDVIAASKSYFSLLGILRVAEYMKSYIGHRTVRSVRPVLAVPGIDPEQLKWVVDFEERNTIKESRLGNPFVSRSSEHQISGR